ncbi:MAG: NAD(P)/FAD-dependent oxidoreductase [Planctomycetota bacterium]
MRARPQRGDGGAPPAVTWRLSALVQDLDEPDASVRERAARELGLDPGELRGFRFARRSIDARRKRGGIHFVCQVDLVVEGARRTPRMARLMREGRVREAPAVGSLAAAPTGRAGGGDRRRPEVVVLGAGPGGLFAALAAALSGAAVTLIERGAPIETRGKKLVAFHRGAAPDPDTNLLFGEGGAGTYSDGKVYTRVDDPLEVPILEELVAAGAPPEIVFDARAHIGTDKLHRILPRLRARMEAAGVRFHFDTRAEGLVVADGPDGRKRVRAVRTSAGALPCDALVVAVGHSARDTWAWLARDGVVFEAKPFQLGVRVEHPQALVTAGRYGEGPEAALLGPASYNLRAQADTHGAAGSGAGAHSFCMCPGGRIVASVNEPGQLCTNGMSNSKHSSRYANAAVVTTLTPDVFDACGLDLAQFRGDVASPGGAALRADLAGPGGVDPFAGVALQRALEARFFAAGGGTYAAPAQRVPDFLAGRLSPGPFATSYGFGAVPGRIDDLLPPVVTRALRHALSAFERQLAGFAGPEGLLVGVETRSSGPVRAPRDRATRLARGFANLFPIGEGAGHAGGITSAAIDGAHAGQSAVLL